MQKHVIILILLFPAVLVQAQFRDDFSDGDFKRNPLWEGDTAKFEINSAGQLHLSGSGADTSVLTTTNSLVERTEWEFWVKLSFNTSANNYARVYLVSDQANPEGSINGYFLQIGGSNDSITFFKQTGNNQEKLFRGNFACTNHSTNIFRLKMVHDSTGVWTLFSDNSGGINYVEEGHCLDTNISLSSWFGISCHYTTSNSTKFYFDDFYSGQIRVDTLPPSVDSISLTDSTQLSILFSENVDDTEARNINHYYTKMKGKPVTAIPDPVNRKKVVLKFQESFPDETIDTLVISGIPDLAGNLMPETEVPFSNYEVKARDVIIDEIMADPEPVTRLPECEYVELYNRTRFPVNLQGWAFDYGSYTKTFPGISIAPHGYLILTKGIMMNYYGPCVDLFTSYSTLPNDGTTLILKNESGKVIHSVSYSTEWYQDPLKENGGWSLEMVDPENPCGCLDNWKASVDLKGGTPGAINSVHASNPDTIRPYLQRARIISDSTVEVLFSESMDSSGLITENQWYLEEHGLSAEAVLPVPPAYNSAIFLLPELLEKKRIYTFSCRNAPYDCAGNRLDTLRSVRIGLPDSVLSGDLVINEILANPAGDGEKFIETYNRSEKILDLKGLALGTFDTLRNLATDLKPLAEKSYLSFPGDFSVLTKNPGDILKRYYCPMPDAFDQMTSFPSLNSEGATVVLARINDGSIIDRVSYSAAMYSELLTTTDGISLERLSPVLSSEDRANWHSASESSRFATPGYKNSTYLQVNPGEDAVTVTPRVFTPDDDGKDDVLWIGFALDDAGYMASISIFDAVGNRVRNLAKNRLMSSEDGLIWNGRDDNNSKSPVGIYILYIELVKTEGRVLHVKKTCVIGGSR